MKRMKKAAAPLLALALAWSLAPPALADTAFSAAPGAGKRDGSVPVVMIVMGFDSDDPEIPDMSYREDYDWGAMLFADEDSVKRYYADQSSGRFAFVPARETSAYGDGDNRNRADRADDGVIHVTLPRLHPGQSVYSTEDELYLDGDRIFQAALDAASEAIDFPSYDVNGDGVLEQDELAVVFNLAGYDSSNTTQIWLFDADTYPGWWPMAWDDTGYLCGGCELARCISMSEMEIDLVDETPVTYVFNDEEPTAGTYADVMDRLMDADEGDYEDTYVEILTVDPSGFIPGSVSTVCHELGHFLGLADYYDTDYSAEEHPGADWDYYAPLYLSLMDSGTNTVLEDNTYLPTSLDAYSLTWLDWARAETAERSGLYTLRSRLSEEGYNILRIDTRNPGEYYLLENRQSEGQDASLSYMYDGETGGIVVWHVDEQTMERWYDDNAVNSAGHHPALTPVYLRYDGMEEELVYTTRHVNTYPDYLRPFFYAQRMEQDLGQAYLDLEIYDAGFGANSLNAMVASGIRLWFLSDPGREMQVYVALPGDPDYAPATAPEPEAPAEPTPPPTFSDVPEGHWAARAIGTVAAEGIMSGDGGVFDPASPMTRAMVAQMLYNYSGGAPAESGFADVLPTDWYAPAVGWASAAGLLQGADGLFRPQDPISRQELVTVLHRFFQTLRGSETESAAEGTVTPDFTDIFTVADYAAPAFRWALGGGLIAGYEDGSVRPSAPVTRAETALIMARFLGI